MNIADIQAETRSLCDADTDSYTADEMLRRNNADYEEVVGKIILNDGTFQFDDYNFTTFPIGVADLVASQGDYTFATEHLLILRVEVKGSNGLWTELSPIDIRDIGGAVSEYMKTAGTPVEYDKQGSSVVLYPAPATGSVTMSSGLRVYFQRTADIFTAAQVATGTKVPGFASPYHNILCYKGAIPYCMKFKQDRVALYERKAMDIEKEMLSFYSRRPKDEVKRVVPASATNK